MTALEYRKHELMCNAAGQHTNYPSAFFQAPPEALYTTSLTALRKLAAKAGWTHVRSPYGRKFSRDYCPEHKPATAAGEASG